MQKLIADKANCTFWWDIHLDRNNAANSVNLITGYSKFQNHDEAKDKKAVLMAKIEMLYKNNWLDKSTHIEIYKRNAPLPNKSEDKLILTLTRREYIIPPELLAQYPVETKNYLKNFYARIAEGKPIENLRPLPKKYVKSKDEYFDIAKYNFKSIMELQDHCFRMLNKGYANGLVENFCRNYTIKHFNS